MMLWLDIDKWNEACMAYEWTRIHLH